VFPDEGLKKRMKGGSGAMSRERSGPAAPLTEVALPHWRSGNNRRPQVGMHKIVALVEQRLALVAGQGVGEAVA